MSALGNHRFLVTAIALACTTALAACAQEPKAEDALTRADFARGISLVPKESRAIHTVLLPREVYRGLVQENFGDLRVYNRAGVAVPHAVRPLLLAKQRTVTFPIIGKDHSLPIFPLRAAPSASEPRSGLDFQATMDSTGAIVGIRLKGEEPKAGTPHETAAAPVVGYLVDASKWHEPLDGLEVVLDAKGEDFLLPVTIETSDDLSSFVNVGPPQALAHLEHDGQTIERTRLDLPALRARYLRLSWGAAAAPNFEKVSAVEAGTTVKVNPLQPERIHGKWEKAGELATYDLGGLVPVSEVRVVLSEDNTLVRVALEGGRTKTGPFEPLHEGVFYRVRHAGALLESEPARVVRADVRYLRLQNLHPEGGAGASVPELEINHHPDQLLYAARGDGPFELVFGHHAARRSAFSAEDLLSMLPEAAWLALPDSDTTLGKLETIAGPSALVAPPPPPPLRKYALWAVLVLAVLVLAWAAFKLARAERASS